MLNDEQPPDPKPKRKLHPLEERPPEVTESSDNVEPKPKHPKLILRIPIVRPIATYILLAINIVIFIIMWLMPEVAFTWLTFGVLEPQAVLLGGEYYRLFTAMFLHIEPAHIFFNGYALYIIGSYIERLFGHARFIVIYFLGGLTGSILMTILNYVDNVSGIGASGALFAIFGAEMVYLIRHRDILGKAASAQLRSLLFLLAINLVIGLLPGSRIGMWAHVGGLIGGLVLTWFISPRFIASPHPAVEGSQVADDTNPLDTKYWIVSLYLIVLVGMLTIVTLIARG